MAPQRVERGGDCDERPTLPALSRGRPVLSALRCVSAALPEARLFEVLYVTSYRVNGQPTRESPPHAARNDSASAVGRCQWFKVAVQAQRVKNPPKTSE